MASLRTTVRCWTLRTNEYNAGLRWGYLSAGTYNPVPWSRICCSEFPYLL